MLLAQLHRKVPSEFERMEDVLTSSVFGLFRYLPDQLAVKLLAKFATIPLLQGPLQLELWPRHPTPAGFGSLTTIAKEEEPVSRGDTEPDVVITTKDWLVLVETKYCSHLDETYDQLGREFAIGYQLAQKENRRFKMLVITAHIRQPTPANLDLETGIKKALVTASAGLGDMAAKMSETVHDSLRWTNWQRVYSILWSIGHNLDCPKNAQRLLEDVCMLLELRGLKPYNSLPTHILTQWEKAGIPDEVWSLPVAYRYHVASYFSSAGWKRLLGLDMSTLHPLAWRLDVSVSNYDLGAHLGQFQLGLLSNLEWQPY